MPSTPLTPEQRTLRARIGAFALHAQGGTSTRAGTAAFLARFEAQVDPDVRLTPEERTRRALLARRAYFGRLALASSRARSKRKAGPVSETSGPAQEDRRGVGDPAGA